MSAPAAPEWEGYGVVDLVDDRQTATERHLAAASNKAIIEPSTGPVQAVQAFRKLLAKTLQGQLYKLPAQPAQTTSDLRLCLVPPSGGS